MTVNNTVDDIKQYFIPFCLYAHHGRKEPLMILLVIYWGLMTSCKQIQKSKDLLDCQKNTGGFCFCTFVIVQVINKYRGLSMATCVHFSQQLFTQST